MLNTNPNTSQKKNPALAYLSRLGSSRSVITISNCLKHIAVILGASDIETADWAKVTSPRPNRARLLTSTARAFRLKGLTEPP